MKRLAATTQQNMRMASFSLIVTLEKQRFFASITSLSYGRLVDFTISQKKDKNSAKEFDKPFITVQSCISPSIILTLVLSFSCPFLNRKLDVSILKQEKIAEMGAY